MFIVLIPFLAGSQYFNSTITSPATPSSSILSTVSVTNGSWNCPACAINADPIGLQQVLWYNDTISLTLDTVSVYVTTYRGLNGSNATAVTKTSTIYGDIAKLNATQVPEASSIYRNYMAEIVPQYIGGGGIFLARGTEGSIGTTSLAWPTPYIRISQIAYASTVPYSGCPSGLAPVPSSETRLTGSCGCAIRSYADANDFAGPYSTDGYVKTEIPLPTNFYYPIPPNFGYNWTALQKGGGDNYAIFNNTNLLSWLTEQPWATSVIPKLDQCIMSGPPEGPPGVKIPVAALTSTATTTIDGGWFSMPSAAPADSRTQPGPMPTPTTPPSTVKSETPLGILQPVVDSTKPSPLSIVGSPTSVNTPLKPSIAPVGVPTHGSELSVSHESPVETGGSSPQANTVIAPDTQTHSAAQPSPVTKGSPSSPDAVPQTPHQPSPVTEGSRSTPSVNPQRPKQPNPVTQGDLSTSDVIPQTPQPIATVAGHTIDLSPEDSSVIVVHGVTPSLGAHPTANPSANSPEGPTGETPDNHPVTPSPKGTLAAGGPLPDSNPLPVIVSDKSITPNAPAITISGTVVSLGSSGLVIGASTLPIQKAPSPLQPITSTLNGQTYTAHPTVVTGDSGSTRTVLGPLATIAGTTIYPSPPDQGSASPPFSNTPVVHPTALVTLNGDTYTVSNSAIQIAGVTVSQGAPAITVDHNPVSLGLNQLVAGSSTVTYSVIPEPTALATLNGNTYTISNNAVQIAGVTVSQGAPAVTVDHTAVSLGSDHLVIGSSTAAYSAVPELTSPAVITVNGETLRVEPSAVVAGSITISEGAPPVTISGTAISLGSTDLVIGSSTLAYTQAAASQSTDGIAGAIISALGRSGTSTIATATATGNITGGNGNLPTPSQTQVFKGRGAKTISSASFAVQVAVVVGSCILAFVMV